MAQEKPQGILTDKHTGIGDKKDGSQNRSQYRTQRFEKREDLNRPQRGNGKNRATRGRRRGGIATGTGTKNNGRGKKGKDSEVEHEQSDASTRLHRISPIRRDHGKVENRHCTGKQLRNRTDQSDQREPPQRPQRPLRRAGTRAAPRIVQGNQRGSRDPRLRVSRVVAAVENESSRRKRRSHCWLRDR